MDVFEKAEVKFPYGSSGPAKKPAPAAKSSPKAKAPPKEKEAPKKEAAKKPAAKKPAKKGTVMCFAVFACFNHFLALGS
jgi:hypothetical protein